MRKAREKLIKDELTDVMCLIENDNTLLAHLR